MDKIREQLEEEFPNLKELKNGKLILREATIVDTIRLSILGYSYVNTANGETIFKKNLNNTK